MNGFDIYIYKFKKEMKRNMCEQKVVSSLYKEEPLKQKQGHEEGPSKMVKER